MCNHIGIEITAKTSFGHGDSTTKITARCKECGAVGETVEQRGFPATYDNMRLAQSNLTGR
jgi:hypothetical protein